MATTENNTKSVNIVEALKIKKDSYKNCYWLVKN